jgi:hypothetical protein
MVTGPPAETAVTTPDVETVAIACAEELQVTVRPVSALPAASRSVAVSGAVALMASVLVPGATVTVATAAGGGGGGGGGGVGVGSVVDPLQAVASTARVIRC